MTPVFVADTGIEVPAVTAEQMREIDRIAVEETGPNLFQMMENAGHNLASQAIDCLGPDRAAANVIVLAGPGGNGGGGICAARHLANRGVSVQICLAEPSRLGPVPVYQLRVFRSTRGAEIEPDRLVGQRHALVIDALVGYSLEGAPRGRTADLIRWANAGGVPILALDLPSGMDASTGETPGEVMQARWTLTLALPKSGLFLGQTGDLILADIGIPQRVYDRLELPYRPPFDQRFRVGLARKQTNFDERPRSSRHSRWHRGALLDDSKKGGAGTRPVQLQRSRPPRGGKGPRHRIAVLNHLR